MEQKPLQLNIFEDNRPSRLNWLLYAVLIFLSVLVVFFNFVTLCGISGVSMEYTLFDGQNVLLLNTKNAQRNDVIVFKHKDKALIKRVIAAESDQLAFVCDQSGAVYVFLNKGSGFKKITEDYIYSAPDPMEEAWFERYALFADQQFKLMQVQSVQNEMQIDSDCVIEVPKNHYFVMGDNRQYSSDSRTIGMVDRSAIYGKLLFELRSGSIIEKILLFIYGAPINTENESRIGLNAFLPHATQNK